LDDVLADPDGQDRFLADVHCRLAKSLGVRLAVSTDAHTVETLDYMRFGVDQARRGWIERDDVINTRDLPSLLKLFRRGGRS
jgi:DNA polymerase (family X)